MQYDPLKKSKESRNVLKQWWLLLGSKEQTRFGNEEPQPKQSRAVIVKSLVMLGTSCAGFRLLITQKERVKENPLEDYYDVATPQSSTITIKVCLNESWGEFERSRGAGGFGLWLWRQKSRVRFPISSKYWPGSTLLSFQIQTSPMCLEY